MQLHNIDLRLQVPRERKTQAAKPCPGCQTNPRSGDRVVCGECWSKVPKKLKGFFGKPARRKEAIQAILTHLKREATEPRLQGF